MALIIFSLTPHWVKAASSNWQEHALVFLDGGPDEVEVARKALLSIPELDKKLMTGIDAGGDDEKKALTVVRVLPRPSLAPALLERLAKVPLDGPRGRFMYATLLTLADKEGGEKVLTQLKQMVPLTSTTTSPSVRVSLMSAMATRSQAPDLKTLRTLLDDPSYEIRVRAVDSLKYDKTSGPDRIQFLKKALAISPYNARLKALSYIEDLTPQERSTYRSELGVCAKSDQNEVVKAQCQKLMTK